MCKAAADHLCHTEVLLDFGRWECEVRGEVIAAADASIPTEGDEGDGLSLAGLEADGGAGSDIEPFEEGELAVERELLVRLGKVIVCVCA
jgi:hypothetical protein